MAVLLVGCQENEHEATDNPLPEGTVQVSYNEVKEATDYENIAVLDVRSHAEYERGNIAGAISMPLDQMPLYFDELASYDAIVVYCHTNNRAQEAFELLSNRFDNVYIYEEGYEKCCS